MLAVIFAIVSALSISVVIGYGRKWGKWFARELSSTILVATLVVSGVFLSMPVSILWWDVALLTAWYVANDVYWELRQRRLPGTRRSLGSRDAAITHWRYLLGLGISMWLLGVALLFLRPDLGLGPATLAVGGFMAITAPASAWKARMLEKSMLREP